MAFYKLKKTKPFTDIVCVGVSVDSTKYAFGKETFHENIHGFHTIHLKPKTGRLFQFGDCLTWDCDDIFNCVCNYLPTRNNVLIVCNHSLVVLGSSDFTAAIEQGVILLDRKEVKTDKTPPHTDINSESESFVASCPPTIVMFTCTVNGNNYTLVDVSNYGIKYMIDIFNNLSNEDKLLVHNESELGVSEDNSLTCAALIARFMQEQYAVVADNKLGGLALTYSSQGMRRFRTHDYQDDILTHTYDDARILEDGCYLGGRVEARYHGHYDGKVYLLDIQSLYPHLGRSKPFPTKLLESQVNPTDQTIEKWLSSGIVFARCHVTTELPAYPVKRDGKLIFPTGSFVANLCCEEFSDAWKEGRIRKVYNGQLYRSGFTLKSYSEHMLTVRSAYKGCNNRLAEYITKVTTNGLWGKLGQYGNLWITMPNEVPDRQYGGYIEYNKMLGSNDQYRIINWEVSRLTKYNWIDNTFIPISACINAYSRHYLWRHMLQAGLHNVLYCCVDGLIVTEEGYNRLAWLIAPTPYQYGMYKVSEMGNECSILGHGIYMIGNKVAYQGVSKYDVKQYRGFWSAIRDVNPIMDKEVMTGKKVASTYRYKDDRGKLLEKGIVNGQFIAVDNLEEPFLYDTDQVPNNYQPSFHVPEWS